MDPWMFVCMADMQPGSPRSFRFNPAWAENSRTAHEQVRRLGPELVIVGGDLTRDGSIHDFELAAARVDLDSLGCPAWAIPGNMDTGNKHAPCQGARDDRYDLLLNVTDAQLTKFAEYFGPVHWTKVHRNVRFTGFYAAVAGSGLASEREMWAILDGLADLPRADHHVVMTHYPLYFDAIDDETFDHTVFDQYRPWYFSIDRPHRERILAALTAAGAEVVISGHIHCYRTETIDGIRFVKAPSPTFSQMTDRWPDGDGTLGFLRFDVTGAGLVETFVPLERVSTATGGYGKGGHPKPEERDYSLAWEK